jgi:hypothetical protein
MKLLELLNMVKDEKAKGQIHIDDWRWADADHLKSMGFEFDGDYMMSLTSPSIKIHKTKTPKGEVFVVDEGKKGQKAFADFEKVIEYFDHYSQPELDKERQ